MFGPQRCSCSALRVSLPGAAWCAVLTVAGEQCYGPWQLVKDFTELSSVCVCACVCVRILAADIQAHIHSQNSQKHIFVFVNIWEWSFFFWLNKQKNKKKKQAATQRRQKHSLRGLLMNPRFVCFCECPQALRPCSVLFCRFTDGLLRKLF